MLIKFIQSMEGPATSIVAGEEKDWTDADEARRLIDAGIAVPVSERPVERAAKKPAPEKRG